MTESSRSESLRQILQRGPARTAHLLSSLGISQPTFSRLWATLADGVVLGAGKARRYALQRRVAGVETPLPLFRITADGNVESIGHLNPLENHFYALTPTSGTDQYVFEGMPYFLSDLRPQGFLGRMEPSRHRDLDLPANILMWRDEHVLKYIARRGEHGAGDLIAGNESLARYLAASGVISAAMIANRQRSKRYPSMAEHAMQGDAPGSSAGGEQPKFTATIQRDAEATIIEHVIVKFSPEVHNPSGRRWGDLLICEHLALEVLARNGIAAAKTSIIEAGGRLFLEVVRFDRCGLKGRLPMATFSALDGEVGMLDQNWTVFAGELGRRNALTEQDVQTVEILDLYGALIGNTDRHHGNIAVAWSFTQRHRLLPAYDMLPMFYRPTAQGEIVAREWIPDVGNRLALRHLARCYAMARQFWADVLNAPRISDEFKRDIASRHWDKLQVLDPQQG